MNDTEVIVLDEIEKAHRSFAKSFLTVFGEHGSSSAVGCRVGGADLPEE